MSPYLPRKNIVVAAFKEKGNLEDLCQSSVVTRVLWWHTSIYNTYMIYIYVYTYIYIYIYVYTYIYIIYVLYILVCHHKTLVTTLLWHKSSKLPFSLNAATTMFFLGKYGDIYSLKQVS